MLNALLTLALPTLQNDAIKATHHASPINLSSLECGMTAIVSEIMLPTEEEHQELVLRLIEIGFVPGEQVRIIAKGHPGDEPIAVRLSDTTFALRRSEADYIRVLPSA